MYPTPARVMLGLFAMTASPAQAADVAVPAQGAGFHSSVSTSDGSVRDDELAAHICNAILAHQGGGGMGPSDVKIMLNSCYGGGVLDDIQSVFGPTGPCAGIPWVGGSASEANAPAYGWPDDVVNHPSQAGKKLGSTWTDALAGTDASPTDTTDGTILQGDGSDKVIDDLVGAGNLDDSGPNGDKKETPQVGSGNGGDQIEWAGGKHEAVVFGGDQSDQRHHNNVNKVTDALNGVWGTDPKNIQTLDGGTTAQLLGAITTAVNNLDATTQLVIYIDDHGDWHFDLDEFLGGSLIADSSSGGSEAFPLAEGLFYGLAGNALQGDPVAPTMFFEPQNPFNSSDWDIFLNGQNLLLPPGVIAGPFVVPVDWEFLHVGPFQNVLDIQPVVPGAPPTLVFQQVEVNSGPINELDQNDQFFRFGPAQGNGCQPGPGDGMFGNPGGGAPVPNGVASTATHAAYDDINGDGQIQIFCEATRNFEGQSSDVMVTELQVNGDWNSPFNIDVNATFVVQIDQGGPPIFGGQNFNNSNGGPFEVFDQSPPFSTGQANNTLRVNGDIQLSGPPGFGAEMHFITSIDGFVLPEPSALQALAAGVALVWALGRARDRLS